MNPIVKCASLEARAELILQLYALGYTRSGRRDVAAAIEDMPPNRLWIEPTASMGIATWNEAPGRSTLLDHNTLVNSPAHMIEYLKAAKRAKVAAPVDDEGDNPFDDLI